MTALRIRWMIRRDMPAVLKIESESFDTPWTEDDFVSCLRQRNCIGMVAERNEEIVGFVVYELYRDRINVLNFAVAPVARRQGIGEAMVDKLKHKLSQQRRKAITLMVRDSNLPAQLFFRSQGFEALGVIRKFYQNDEDAYEMAYRLGVKRTFALKNRIVDFLGAS